MKIIQCKFCNRRYTDPSAYASHLEASHSDMIPEDMSGYQYYYYLKTGKKNGTCVVCKKPTKWNESTGKYHRFCDNPKCKEAYVKEFQKRMMGKYGKTTLLNDPEQQKKMLANRSISGSYKFHTGEVIPYTGSYEKEFLIFLDEVMDFDGSDIMAPSPHTYYYDYNGSRHFYIPDFFIPSINLEIEIKDGGDNPNKHPKIQEVDKEKERLKDEVMKDNLGKHNYLKISNKDHKKFLEYLLKAKENFFNDIKTPIFMI